MNEVFVPPVMATPSGGDQNFNAPNVANISPGQERQSQFAKTVGRSRKVRQATNTVIKTRSQFKSYLQQNGLNLYTSAVEFQTTGDFILSSYVVYSSYSNYMEPLSSFLQRYPNLIQPVSAIRDSLRSVKDNMDVISPSPFDPKF